MKTNINNLFDDLILNEFSENIYNKFKMYCKHTAPYTFIFNVHWSNVQDVKSFKELCTRSLNEYTSNIFNLKYMTKVRSNTRVICIAKMQIVDKIKNN